MIKVDSSCLDAVQENQARKTLDIQFKSGATYRYHDVPHHVVETMLSADSVGKYFSKNVRNSFRYEKIDRTGEASMKH